MMQKSEIYTSGDNFPHQFRLTKYFIRYFEQAIISNHDFIFSNLSSEKNGLDTVLEILKRSIYVIEKSSASYHDIEHTFYVVCCGLEIIKGKFIVEGNVSERDWQHYVIALLFHDIGYIKNILEEDNSDGQWISDGGERIKLKETDTDAVLTNFHVYRGERFSKYYLKNYKNIDSETIAKLISGTQFPIPETYENDVYNRLLQAADLIGQMADIYYMSKTTALFDEFEENNALEKTGVSTPLDLISAYPKFFWGLVFPNIKLAIRYLDSHEDGRIWMSSLINQIFYEENNVLLNEKASTLLKEVLGVKHFARNHSDKLQLLSDILKNYYSAQIAHVYTAKGDNPPKLVSANVWSYEGTKYENFKIETERLSFVKGYGMPGMAWESGEVQWISNLGEMDPVKFPRAIVCKEAGIKFAFSIPYFIGETCNDIIEVFSEVAVEPTATDKEFIKIITATLNS